MGDGAAVRAALARSGVSLAGLLPAEQAYLRILREAKGPLGLATIAGRLGLSKQTVRVHERFLLRRGLLEITARGRCAVEDRRAA